MSRGFTNKKAQILCLQRQCRTTAPLDAPDYPLADMFNVSDTAEERERRNEVSDDAFRLLYAAPLPKGWLRVDGGNHYRDRNSTIDQPEFCSLRCARLWISAREKGNVD